MKRYTRWVALAAVVAVCLSLCGCARLDEMKEKHAVWLKGGSILWNGVEYKPLQTNFDVDVNWRRFNDSVTVTTADVPVLLSEEYGRTLDADVESGFIYGYAPPLGNNYLFCRADMYDEVSEKVGEGFKSAGYCYNYYTYEAFDTQNGFDTEEKTYYLTAEQEYAISYVVDTAMYYFEYDDFKSGYEVMLYSHYELDLYRNFEMRLAYSGGGYYVVMDGIVYLVKAEYEPIMREILQPGYSAYYQQQKEWYE